MGFRFYKRVNLIPGLRMNLSCSGPSLSIGRGGAWFTVGPRGKRLTVGGLGIGLFYTTKIPPAYARFIQGTTALGYVVLAARPISLVLGRAPVA
jgi:Protein of unknown function (DUF4236)